MNKKTSTPIQKAYLALSILLIIISYIAPANSSDIKQIDSRIISQVDLSNLIPLEINTQSSTTHTYSENLPNVTNSVFISFDFGQLSLEQLALAELNTQKMDYGSEFGKRYFVAENAKFYAGIGMFIGNDFFNIVQTDCSSSSQFILACSISNSAAIYPELGYMLSVGNTNIAFYNRQYHFYDQQPKEQMLGFDVSYDF